MLTQVIEGQLFVWIEGVMILRCYVVTSASHDALPSSLMSLYLLGFTYFCQTVRIASASSIVIIDHMLRKVDLIDWGLRVLIEQLM